MKILDQMPKIKTLYDQVMPPENRFPSPEATLDLIFAMVVIPLAVVVTLSDELRLRSLKSVKIQASLKRLGLLKEERGIKEKRKLKAVSPASLVRARFLDFLSINKLKLDL